MKTVKRWLLAGVAMTVVAGFAMVGCESTKTEDNIITVTPTVAHVNSGAGAGCVFHVATAIGDTTTISSTGSGSSNTTTLTSATTTNQTLYYPLVWSVSDPSLGVITSSEGNVAVYEVRGTGREGNNIITVHDQGDSRGEAVVEQRSFN